MFLIFIPIFPSWLVLTEFSYRYLLTVFMHCLYASKLYLQYRPLFTYGLCGLIRNCFSSHISYYFPFLEPNRTPLVLSKISRLHAGIHIVTCLQHLTLNISPCPVFPVLQGPAQMPSHSWGSSWRCFHKRYDLFFWTPSSLSLNILVFQCMAGVGVNWWFRPHL